MKLRVTHSHMDHGETDAKTGSQRQVELSEFEANLVYIVSSRPPRAIE